MGVGVLDPADYGRSLCRGSNLIVARHELRLGVGGHPYSERVFQENCFFVSCITGVWYLENTWTVHSSIIITLVIGKDC